MRRSRRRVGWGCGAVLGLVLGAGAFVYGDVALQAQPTPQQVKRAPKKAAIPKTRSPAGPAPRIPADAAKIRALPGLAPAVERPHKTSKGEIKRTFEKMDASGKVKVTVTVRASGWVDKRALEYLERSMLIVALAGGDRPELAALRGADAKADGHSDEVLVELSPADAKRFQWVAPDGFELVRPEGAASARQQRRGGRGGARERGADRVGHQPAWSSALRSQGQEQYDHQ